MSLSTAMEVARNNLSVLTAKSSVVSRNIANASNSFASRKTANTATAPNGGVYLASITRSSDQALFNSLLSANSDSSRQQAVVDGLTQLQATVNDTEADTSPAALIGKLSDALQQYSAAPSDQVRAQAAVTAAQDVATSLNNASDTVQKTRAQADGQIADSVANLNSLLSEFGQVNRQIVNGTHTGADITDYLDQRDQILSDMSKEVGIKTVSRQNNDMAIYSDSGVTMFDVVARSVTFDATSNFTPSTVGNAVMIDGVAVTGSGASMSLNSGKIKGLAEIRDETAVTYQNQLDETARGLIETFAETDAGGSGGAGLFTNSSSLTVPPGGTVVTGLARNIKVNAAIDPSQSGVVTRLRDGVTGSYNPTGATGYSDHLLALIDGMNAPRSFDSAAQIGTNTTLKSFATSSVGWLEQTRQTTSNALDYNNTVQQRASDSLTKETGVNLDYEMTVLLDLEHSFQATSRLISTIDNMYSYLLQAAGN